MPNNRVCSRCDARVDARTNWTFPARSWDTVYRYNEVVVRPYGNEVVATFDALGQMTQQVLPESRTQTTTYDLVGNVKTQTNGCNFGTTLTYDNLNRVTLSIDALSQSVAATFYAVDNVLLLLVEHDAVSNEIRHTDANGNVSAFVFDARRRLFTETNGANETSTYT